MNSEFDVQVAYLSDIYKQASLDSQRLQSQIRILREQMEQMQKTIQSKTQGIMREMVPRIEQLQQKMSANWGSIESMDKVAWQQLQSEQLIFSQCQNIVRQMEQRIQDVNSRDLNLLFPLTIKQNNSDKGQLSSIQMQYTIEVQIK